MRFRKLRGKASPAPSNYWIRELSLHQEQVRSQIGSGFSKSQAYGMLTLPDLNVQQKDYLKREVFKGHGSEFR